MGALNYKYRKLFKNIAMASSELFSPQILQYVSESFDGLRGFLNSTFISAFLSALAGAGFGVWGAQRLAARTARKAELQEGLSQANALIVWAAMVANEALSMKKQHVAPITEAYFKDRKYFDGIREKLLRGEGVPPQKLCFDFISIPPIRVPIDALKNSAYSGRLVPGRALVLVSALDQYLNLLSLSLELRSEQINKFKSKKNTPEELRDYYFGFEREGGKDSVYHDSMLAIKLYTNDVAFFGVELADELQTHADELQQKLKMISHDVPKKTRADFSEARNSGLLPPRENYESWLKGFPKSS